MQQEALTRTLVLRKKMIWCVFDYAGTNVQTASEVVHLLVAHECVSKVLMGEKGLGWPTKDICGMSLLGEGLQLVVSPAVLPVAVPGMLHHLEDKERES